MRQARPEHALVLTGAAAGIRERFHVATNSSWRTDREQQIDTARRQVGAEATAWWMKGWNMSAEEIVEWAARDPEELLTRRLPDP